MKNLASNIFNFFLLHKFIFVTEPTIQMLLNLSEPHLRTLRSDVTLFIKLNLIFPSSELLNEILCIPVAQGAAKLPDLRFEGHKKDEKRGQAFCDHGTSATRMHSISFIVLQRINRIFLHSK